MVSDTNVSPLTVSLSPDMLALKLQQVAAKTVPTSGESRLLRKAREQQDNRNNGKQVGSDSSKVSTKSNFLFLHCPHGNILGCFTWLCVNSQKKKNEVGNEKAKESLRPKVPSHKVPVTSELMVSAADNHILISNVQACMRSKHRLVFMEV